MDQIYQTRLSCSDPATLDSLMAKGWQAELEKDHEVSFYPGNPAEIISKWTNPIRELRLMSKEYPVMVFTAELTCTTDEHPVTHVLEFINGEEREIYQRPNYSIQFYPPAQYIGQPYYELMDNAVEVFQRVDVSRGEEGILVVDPVLHEIQIMVEGAEYLIKVRKQGYNVEVAECLKKRPGTVGKWLDMTKELKDKYAI